MPKAAIFDLDGTLLDSVDLHALAWHEAMAKFGHDVSFEQARGQIGKGGDKLIPVFLSDDEQRDHGKEMEEWRGKRFKSEYLPLVRPFSAVPNLLRRVRDAGVRVAVASSAKKDELGNISTSRTSPTWSKLPRLPRMPRNPSRPQTSSK
jgi:phosphoglycolate phosphatase-like HAD superfamily hydrolase